MSFHGFIVNFIVCCLETLILREKKIQNLLLILRKHKAWIMHICLMQQISFPNGSVFLSKLWLAQSTLQAPLYLYLLGKRAC